MPVRLNSCRYDEGPWTNTPEDSFIRSFLKQGNTKCSSDIVMQTNNVIFEAKTIEIENSNINAGGTNIVDTDPSDDSNPVVVSGDSNKIDKDFGETTTPDDSNRVDEGTSDNASLLPPVPSLFSYLKDMLPDERPTNVQIGGAVLVLLAVYVAVTKVSQNKRSSSNEDTTGMSITRND